MKALPSELAEALAQLGKELRSGGRFSRALLEGILVGLSQLSPAAIAQAEREIASAAALYHRDPPGLPATIFGLASSDRRILDDTPGLECLYLFHRDGRIREAALDRMRTGLPTGFWLAAVAWRLNDWAVPVRDASRRCLQHILPRTEAAVIAEAGLFLLGRIYGWQRWTDGRTVLEQAFARPDVARHMATLFAGCATGPLGKLLRQALRQGAMDAYLPSLARQAVQPVVRAVALQALIRGRASWLVGFERRWVDKPYNVSRRVAVFETRPILRPKSIESLIMQGARDTSASVRKIAADSLIEYGDTLVGIEAIVRELGADRNALVRERAEFILRTKMRRGEPPSGG